MLYLCVHSHSLLEFSHYLIQHILAALTSTHSTPSTKACLSLEKEKHAAYHTHRIPYSGDGAGVPQCIADKAIRLYGINPPENISFLSGALSHVYSTRAKHMAVNDICFKTIPKHHQK